MEILLKALIAALLTLAVERVPKLWEAIQLRRKHFALLGNWFGYHYSFKDDKPQLFSSEWKVRPAIFRAFHVEVSLAEVLHYKGHILFEGNDRIVFSGHATTQVEFPTYRFPNPLRSAGDVLAGIWLSYDHDKHIAAGGALLSRRKLSEAEVLEHLKAIRVGRHGKTVLPLIRRRQ